MRPCPALSALLLPPLLPPLPLPLLPLLLFLPPEPCAAAPGPACANFSKESCEDCLRNISCLWCSTKETCLDYPVSSLLPSSSLCPLADTRWAACWINLEALVIAISVIVGILLLSVTICCCYCCYCRKRARRLDDDEDRLTRQREERRMQSLQRKHERKKQHDEIRKKYGLLQDSDHPYSRLEND